MEQVHKRGLLIIALMVFSLVFALSPSYGSYEEPVSPAKKIESDPLATFKEGDYPVYENSKKIANSEIVTPLDLGETVASPVTVEDEVEEDDDMFFDQAEYDAAPTIKVLAESKRIKYRLIVLQHERFFRDNERKLYVPRLKKQLSVEEFSKHFLEKSQPVIVRFDLMRHLNFTTRAYTLDELLEIYPNHKPMVYRYGGYGQNQEIDLGPAVATLKNNVDLKKTKIGRNFPRNTKVNPAAMKKLGLSYPPFVFPGTTMMAPSLWFGVSTSSTKTHSDCCDNFAVMITGTKRWTVAPPSEGRLIKPKCNGGLCWGNRLEHADEHAYTPAMKKLRDMTQLVSFDLNPGEMLYLPAGWFHHIENVGPTIMVNYWSKAKPFFQQVLDGDAEEVEF